MKPNFDDQAAGLSANYEWRDVEGDILVGQLAGVIFNENWL